MANHTPCHTNTTHVVFCQAESYVMRYVKQVSKYEIQTHMCHRNCVICVSDCCVEVCV